MEDRTVLPYHEVGSRRAARVRMERRTHPGALPDLLRCIASRPYHTAQDGGAGVVCGARRTRFELRDLPRAKGWNHPSRRCGRGDCVPKGARQEWEDRGYARLFLRGRDSSRLPRDPSNFRHELLHDLLKTGGVQQIPERPFCHTTKITSLMISASIGMSILMANIALANCKSQVIA